VLVFVIARKAYEMNLGKIKNVISKSILANKQNVAFSKDWLRRKLAKEI
jgi:hypothetical protein